MRIVDTRIIEEKIYEMALKAGVTLTPACVTALKEARKAETGASAAYALETVLYNREVAERNKMPVCQDTGLSVVFMEIGQEVRLIGELLTDAVNSGVRRAYADGYFRKSVCDPITRKNTTDNTPVALHTEIVSGDMIKIAYLPKGFGSENMSRIYMLTPSKGVEGIIEAVVETVRLAGSRPCPPVYVGVGIGGTFDSCALNAKKALIRDVGTLSEREDVRKIELQCLERINGLGIGAQGFGGKVTTLGVSCEVAPTHIAGLPVAVNVQCHCIRAEKAVI